MTNRLRELRLKHGWTMAELGARLDPPAEASQINKLEKGHRELTQAWMTRLAAALGCLPADLISATVPLVGYVGAGAVILGVDDHALGAGLEEVDRPPEATADMVAVRVRGDSMEPRYEDGDLVYYRRAFDFIEADCLGRECVVKVEGGEIYLKKLLRGSLPGRFTLRSHNAPDIPDVKIEWAAPVFWHKPQ